MSTPHELMLSLSLRGFFVCAQLKDSKVVRQAGVTSRGRSEFVQEIVFERLTPGSVIAFRLDFDEFTVARQRFSAGFASGV